MKRSPMTAEKIPTKYEAENFWKNIWRASDKTFNEDSFWLSELKMTFSNDVQPKQHEITKDTLKTAVNKIHFGKSGKSRDLLIRYWF